MRRLFRWPRSRLARWRAKRLTTNRYDVTKWLVPAMIYTAAGLVDVALLVRGGGEPWERWSYLIGSVVLFAMAAPLWAAWRYARIDVIMTDTWWMSSRLRLVIVGALLCEAAAHTIVGAAYRQWNFAYSVVLDLLLAWYWWKQWGDGGRGWDDEDIPDWPQSPEDHDVDLPPELVEPEMRPRSVDAGPVVDDRVRGKDAA